MTYLATLSRISDETEFCFILLHKYLEKDLSLSYTNFWDCFHVWLNASKLYRKWGKVINKMHINEQPGSSIDACGTFRDRIINTLTFHLKFDTIVHWLCWAHCEKVKSRHFQRRKCQAPKSLNRKTAYTNWLFIVSTSWQLFTNNYISHAAIRLEINFTITNDSINEVL